MSNTIDEGDLVVLAGRVNGIDDLGDLAGRVHSKRRIAANEPNGRKLTFRVVFPGYEDREWWFFRHELRKVRGRMTATTTTAGSQTET